jgi:hypothetical protein
MPNDDLEKLKKQLYKKKGWVNQRLKREKLRPSADTAKTYWQKSPSEKKDLSLTIEHMRKRRKFPFFLVFGLLFLAAAVVGLLFYIFTVGGNIISSRNIDLVIEGPSVVKAGEAGKWYILVTNNNKVSLELADLIINYPKGILSLKSEQLLKERRQIGKVLAGQTIKEEVHVFVLGKEDEQKEIDITLEYRTEGSNAIFAKSEKQIIKLSRSPIGISINTPKETESGQPITITVEAVSNSDAVLKDIYLKMDYPPGFQFLESSLEPAKGNDAWAFGDLAPQDKRSLEIKGILEGEDLTELSFRASVGSLDDSEDFSALNSMAESILLKKPFLNLGFLINGKDIDIISGGKSLAIAVPWKNNLPTEIRNARVNVKLFGRVVDLRTISVDKGFYRSFDNTIIWNASSLPALASIAPGESGSAAFSFSLKDFFPVEVASDKNFIFELQVEMIGIRTGEEGQSFEVKSSASKQVKIASIVQLASRALHSSGPFVNSGFLPPKVGEETTYTVVWSISNFYNDVSNVVVRASIPSYVSWLGEISPSDENIVYNPSTSEVVWEISRIEAGTGILRPAKEVAFKISFLPAPHQADQSPMLVSQTSLESKDLFTGLILRDLEKFLNTASINEAQANRALGRVVE